MSHTYYVLCYRKRFGNPVALASQAGVRLDRVDGRSSGVFRFYGDLSEVQVELLLPFFSITQLEVSDAQEDQAFYEEMSKETDLDHLGGLPAYAMKMAASEETENARRRLICAILSAELPSHTNAIQRWMKISS